LIIDSHCHLDILPEDKFGDAEQVIKTAKEHDVTAMMCIAINPNKWDDVLDLANKHDNVYAAMGIHPCETKNVVVSDEQLLAVLDNPKVLAVGEVGLDYFHYDIEKEDMTWQQERFRQMIRIAKQVNKPLVIHTRNSTEDCLRILKEEGAEKVGGIMHCFVESLAVAEQAMALGFYISFSGIVTFKNAKEIKEVAKTIPLDKILVETDAPYLAPVPYRGKQNQPAYTKYVVEEIANLRGISYEEAAKQTTVNFKKLFKLF